MKSRLPTPTRLALLLLVPAFTASAANITWSGAQSSDWGDGANWVGGEVPGVDDIAVFTGSIANSPIDLGATDRIIAGVDFQGAGAFTLNGTGALIIDTALSNNFLSAGFNSGALTVNAPIEIRNGQTNRLNVNVNAAGNLIFNGVVSESAEEDGGGVRTVRKTGGGTLTLNNANNTFTGGLRIEAGGLRLGTAGAQGTGSIVWAASGSNALVLQNTVSMTIDNDLHFAATANTGQNRAAGDAGTTLTFTTNNITSDRDPDNLEPIRNQLNLLPNTSGTEYTVRFTGDNINSRWGFNTSGGALMVLDFAPASGTQVWNGLISGGNLTNMHKSGDGTVVLTNNTNTFAGTFRVNQGLLVIDGNLPAGAGFIVESDGALGGSGNVGGAAGIVVHGAIAPGHNGIGTLTANTDLTWNGGQSWLFELGAANASDRLVILGDFIKGTGDTFNFDLGGTGAVGEFILVSFTGVVGFAAEDFSFSNLNDNFTAELVFGTDDIRLNVIPEPSAFAILAGVAALGFVVTRRRRG